MTSSFFKRTTARRPLAERFWEKVDKNGPLVPPMKTRCWVWRGAIQTGSKGSSYGALGVGGGSKSTLYAHRVSYELDRGTPIPGGMTIDHICRNTVCVRPSHLRLATQRENNLYGYGWGGVNARKTTCPRGHPYDSIGHKGERRCRRCHAAQERMRRAARA